MQLDPAKVSSVNGYDIIEIEGAYGLFEDDVRDGVRQIGPNFNSLEAAAEDALTLGKPSPADEFQFPPE